MSRFCHNLCYQLNFTLAVLCLCIGAFIVHSLAGNREHQIGNANIETCVLDVVDNLHCDDHSFLIPIVPSGNEQKHTCVWTACRLPRLKSNLAPLLPPPETSTIS
jgi:hypothetical protein